MSIIHLIGAPNEGVGVPLALLESPAWRSMSIHAQRVVFCIMIEHAAHAGTMNGQLSVTYSDFEDYGSRRKSITAAIAEAEALGLIKCTGCGQRAGGTFKSSPATYRLEWLPSKDGEAAAQLWKRFDSIQEAKAVGAAARAVVENRRKPTGTAP